MKRGLFLALAIAGLQLNAQQAPEVKDQKVANEAAPMIKKAYTGAETQNTVPVLPRSKKSVLGINQIGESVYDLQTNGSVDNRIQYVPSTGQISAAWTHSSNNDPFSDRGTGYNFYNSTTWGSIPATRLESERTGWPSVVITDTSEFIVSHSGTDLLTMIRATPGFGTWTEDPDFTDLPDGGLWPRAVSGGTDNKTVHVLAITTPVANGGTPYRGFDGALMYWRSQDGGYNWDIKDSILPGIDTADHFGFNGDGYAIDAKGNTVAIGVFKSFEPSFLLKSTDNGDTWTRTVFWDTGLRDYVGSDAGTVSDVNNDGIIDTVETSDNSGAVLIDNNGDVHVFFGRQRNMDDDPAAAGTTSYFPVTNGIFYWNENSTGPAQVITGAPDLDNDGVLGITATTEVAQYFQSLSTFPNAGIDANGNIFLTFSALNELEFSGAQFFNKIFMVSSRDGGASWSNIRELTAGQPLVECVFPSLARTVDDKLRLIYQLDGEPGLTVRGDLDPAGINEIMFLDADTASDVSLTEYDIMKGEISSIYPNPATDKVSLQFSVKVAGEYTVQVTNITGVVVKTIDLGNMPSGIFSESLDLQDLTAGVYIVSLRSGEYSTSKRLIIQ